MRLISAPGSREMQLAISRYYVREIAHILLSIIGQDFFKTVTLFLQYNDQATSPEFEKKLQALRTFRQSRPDAEGRFITPNYVDELIGAVKMLYEQHQNRVRFERGAVVELLASELVNARCDSGECKNNHRFVDGRFETDQVDVAVLSESRREIEGYACKIKPIGIMSEDCTNLTALASKAQELGYEVEIGAISFDYSRFIAQRLQDRLNDISHKVPFNAYGVDNMQDLGENPF